MRNKQIKNCTGFSLLGKTMVGMVLILFSGLSVSVAQTAVKENADAKNPAPLSEYAIKRPHTGEPDIVYYLSSPPAKKSFPLILLIGGSSDQDNIVSITEFHRYFLKDFEAIGAGALTVEQWGIAGQAIDKEAFMAHYTRTQRLQDHQAVIEHIRRFPPPGWNGKLALLAVSEGGNIAMPLIANPDNAIAATAMWSGAGDWSWREELWVFLQSLCVEGSAKGAEACQNAAARQQYEARLDEVVRHPSAQHYYVGMTNRYMADALTYPGPDYKNIQGKLLMVTGVKDTLIQSSDDFYKKAKQAGMDVTYWRIEDMDHYIRNRPELIKRSFEWLKQQLEPDNSP